MRKYLKRTATHYGKSRKEAFKESPWANFVTKAIMPNGDRRYTCFEFIGDYQTYLFFRNEEYFTL
jgi:hypothetical protein